MEDIHGSFSNLSSPTNNWSGDLLRINHQSEEEEKEVTLEKQLLHINCIHQCSLAGGGGDDDDDDGGDDTSVVIGHNITILIPPQQQQQQQFSLQWPFGT